MQKNIERHMFFLKGSSFSAMTFGHPACGIAPTNVRRLHTDALAATGIGKGRCTFTSLDIFYGEYPTPFARIISELLTVWFKLLKTSKNDEHFNTLDIRNTWAKARETMKIQTTNKFTYTTFYPTLYILSLL